VQDELAMAWRVAVAVLAGLLAWPAQPVLAQGVLQQLFGSGSEPPPRLYGYPGARPNPYLGLPPNRSMYVWPASPFGSQPAERRDDAVSGRAGTYRTLCVRLCDGFYFPISSATIGSGLARDADACSATCGTETRLFYHPNDGGNVDSMVDLTGLAYSALPNAFKYRKTLVPECRCRPQPWSEAELQRHRAYAGGGSVAADTGSPPSPPVRESRAPPSGDSSAVARPAQAAPGPAGALSDDRPWAIERPDPVVRETGAEPWPFNGASSGGATRSKYALPPARRD
jgi:hypothetical protein